MNLLLAAVLLLQDKTPEETFKKIEEAATLKAEISCRFDASGTVRLKKLAFRNPSRGVVVWGSQDRFSIRAAEGSEDFETNYYLISTGKRAVVRRPTSLAIPFLCPKEGARVLKANWIRAGVFLGFLAIEPGRASGDAKEPIVEAFRISDVTAEPGGAEEGALTYTLVLGSCELTAKVTLWYDAKSFLPKKRMIDLSGQEREVRLTESYDN